MLHAMFAVNSRDKTIMPAVISLFTWSKCYHVELLFTDNMALTSTPKGGVHFIERRYDTYNWVALPIPWVKARHAKEIRRWGESLVEAKTQYDFSGAVFGRFSKKMDNPKKYFCSELVAEALRQYSDFLRNDRWYSPEMLWQSLSNHLSAEFPQYDNRNNYRLRYRPTKGKSSTEPEEID